MSNIKVSLCENIEIKENGHLLFGGQDTVMLAEKYRDITIKDDFIIASYRNDANWDIIDELYLLDGTPVFTDIYRRVSIDGDKLTRETPLGLEHYRIVRN